MHSKHFKVLCLAICALTALMAVSASTAQAKWLLLRQGVSVGSLEYVKTIEAITFLVPNLGLMLQCSKGTGSGKVSGGGTTTLSGTATIVFAGCDVTEGFEEVCSVRGSTDAKGSNKITMKGNGVGSMSGSEVFLTTESTSGSPFTNITIEGEECPFIEIDGRTFGSLKLSILTPLTDSATHVVHLTSQSLIFGSNPAAFHSFLGTITEITGDTFAFHLRELPGCPIIC